MYVILLSNKKEHTTDAQHRQISKTLCSAKEIKHKIIIYISPLYEVQKWVILLLGYRNQNGVTSWEGELTEKGHEGIFEVRKIFYILLGW